MIRPVFLVAFSLSAQARAQTLSLGQLEALSRQGQSSEVLARAREVPPDARTPAWTALVQQAAVDELSRLGRVDPETALATMEGWFDVYRALEQHAPLADGWLTLASTAFEACLAGGDARWCTVALLQRSRRVANPSKALLAAATRLPPRERDVRLVLAGEVARREPASVPCDAPWLSDAVVDDAGRSDEAGPDVTALVGACGPRLGKAALARLLEPESRRRTLCPSLLKVRGFDGVQRARCERAIAEVE